MCVVANLSVAVQGGMGGASTGMQVSNSMGASPIKAPNVAGGAADQMGGDLDAIQQAVSY